MAHLDLSPPHMRLSRRAGLYKRFGKRTLDLGLAVLLLPVLAPLIAILWLCARAGGPSGLYAHHRVGRNGVPFRCWKIRTMYPNADWLPDHLKINPRAAAEWARCQKLEEDPRVTRLGRFLRRTSLDELPQIFNVLTGEMSFVGPRPVTEDELVRYGADRGTYLALRPGITGLWQVRGRRDGCYDNRLRHDRTYADQMGMALDLRLILQTVVVVMKPTGK